MIKGFYDCWNMKKRLDLSVDSVWINGVIGKNEVDVKRRGYTGSMLIRCSANIIDYR